MPPAVATDNAAIYYAPEAFTISGPKLMGRNAAGASFLKGFARHARVSSFDCFVEASDHGREFAARIAAEGRREPVRMITRPNMAALADAGSLHFPSPYLTKLAWERSLFGHTRWSITGVTHTTASDRAMDSLTDLLTAPVQPWDAVICTSEAVRANVRCLLDAQQAYLRERLGATRFVEPELPMIPLGIVTDDFHFSDNDRRSARDAIGADAETIVVLFAGRLSFHAKAHPLAMYQALEAARRTVPPGMKIMLVECGWHANDYIAKAFAAAAAYASPGVDVRVLDGRRPDERKTAWASADVFCSLSDNIQETFGLVPIEAMAAGLPCVVSDWNGYKSTVRDGIDGFRIATLAPSPGAATDMAAAHALGTETYDMYCGQTCMMISVDVQATADAFSRLFNDAELRRTMGEAGRRRAREQYDWSAIVPQYQSLWAELAARRSRAAEVPLAHPWPARMDPFAAFAEYPTRHLTLDTALTLGDPDFDRSMVRLSELEALDMVSFAKRGLLDRNDSSTVLAAAARGPATARELIEGIAPAHRPYALRALARLTKLGILRLA